MADINELKVLISNLGINIEKNHSSLSVKIDEVNNSISAEIKNLEDRAFREIQGLKESHKELQRAFDFNKDSVNDSIGLLRTDLTSQQDAIDRKSNELQIALLKLEVQSERVVQLEKVCHSGLQHNRGWNVEIDGIPANVGDDPYQLEIAVIEICNKINVGVNRYDIDTVHRLPSERSPKPTIVRFSTRKVVRDLHDNKKLLKDLNDLNLEIPGLNANSKIFIRASQSPYVKNLAYNCRQLKRSNKIAQVITGKDGRLTIKTLDGDFLKIGHEHDLTSIIIIIIIIIIIQSILRKIKIYT